MCVNCSNNACGGCQPQIPQGLPGANGKNAYTFTTASFTMPAVSSSVTINVQNSGQFTNQWAVPGQIIYIDGAGYFQVVNKTGTNQITVTNLGYPGNTAPSTTIATNSGVSPAGLQGPTGASGANGANGTTSIYADSVSVSSATTLSPVTLTTFAIPANTWVNYNVTNADSVLINLSLNIANSIAAPTFADVLFNNCQVYLDNNLIVSSPGLVRSGVCNISLRLTKASSSLFYAFSRNYTFLAPIMSQSGVTVSTFNFATLLSLEIKIIQSTANNIEIKGITIDKITA